MTMPPRTFRDVPLAPLTTLEVGGPARALARASCAAAASASISSALRPACTAKPR
mgnify:CR=1 FL=1